jgi:CHASE3 domain sensor protein
MEESKIKLPQKDGVERAVEIFNRTRKKQPSDRLVKIISDIPELEQEKKHQDDQAAKDAEI